MIKVVNRFLGEGRQDIEPGGGDCLVETSGYIPKETQLQMLMQSGEALDRYRKKMFPGYTSEDEEPDFDPTAQKGYDFFDFHEDVVYLKKTISDREAALRASVATPPVAETAPPAGETGSPEGVANSVS
jgi:hypothetical protein